MHQPSCLTSIENIFSNCVRNRVWTNLIYDCLAFFCPFYYRLELNRIFQAVLPSCWLVANLYWWERERGRNMGMTCEEWLRYSTELCHWTHCSGIPYRPFYTVITFKFPEHWLKTDLVSPHLSLNVRGPSTKLTPDKHNFLFQLFTITATRPSTHSWEGNGGRDTQI